MSHAKPLPDDWPRKFRQYVIDAATRYAAETRRPHANEELALEKATTTVLSDIDDASHEAFDEAPSSWQRRYESAKMHGEIESAVRYYAHHGGDEPEPPKIVRGRIAR